ncbi:MAG: hypothetical protein D3910_20290, partial [Candidatus Electrothrix sp. ATG2]|nr:hypothetical protein [Candidatus Electrothrix sp. ATG2]
MNSSLGSEIVTGFIGEVEGYLPDMSRCLQTLRQDSAHRPSLAELHRITHTIKGAAAMVGLEDLSGVGELLEKVMENVLADSLDLDDETITLLEDATQHIDSYCTMQRAGTSDDQLFGNILAQIEKKLRQRAVGSGEVEASTERSNPEAIFNEDEIEEETALENETDILFADTGIEPSEETDTETLLEELTTSTTLTEEAEDAEEDDLFFRTDEEEDDDLFGSSLVSDQAASVQDSHDLFETPETHLDDTPAIDAIDPELLQCFREEADEHLENIDSCLNSLSVQVTD